MKKNRFTIIVVGLIVLAIILIGVLQASKSDRLNMEPVEDQRLIYQGDQSADNEMLFLFDYACHWCTTWMNDVYPTIKSDYIDTGELKFRTQAMVYVNDTSLQLANLDQNLKAHAEEDYLDVFQQIIADSELDLDGLSWGSEYYISEVIDSYQLDSELMLAQPDLDSIQLSRTYTRALEVDVVPTIYINGLKVEDAFNLEQIDKLIK